MRAIQFGQVPGCGVRVGHPVDVAQPAVDRVSETSGSASGFLAVPGVSSTLHIWGM